MQADDSRQRRTVADSASSGPPHPQPSQGLGSQTRVGFAPRTAAVRGEEDLLGDHDDYRFGVWRLACREWLAGVLRSSLEDYRERLSGVLQMNQCAVSQATMQNTEVPVIPSPARNLTPWRAREIRRFAQDDQGFCSVSEGQCRGNIASSNGYRRREAGKDRGCFGRPATESPITC